MCGQMNHFSLTLTRPLRRKVADEFVFRRFQGRVEFFLNRTSLTPPPQIFDAHLL